MQQNLDDIKLFALLQAGDEMAFTQVYNKYNHNVYLSAYMVLRSEPEARDMVQEVFTLVWVKKSCLKIETSLKSYLNRTATNLSINKAKSQSIYKNHTLQYTLQHRQVEYPTPMEQSDAREKVDNLLKNVSEAQRKSVEKIYGEEMSYKEAAQHLGTSINTISKQVLGAIKLMRANPHTK